MATKFKVCKHCKKLYAKYYRDGDYWCNKTCYKKFKAKEAEKKEETSNG